MIDLPELAARLNDAGLINKSFMDMAKSDIETLIGAVFSCPDDEVPVGGWAKPHLEDMPDGVPRLVIPFDSHPKYYWWQSGGQDLLATLVELDAPWATAKRYLENKGIKAMTEDAYIHRLIPF